MSNNQKEHHYYHNNPGKHMRRKEARKYASNQSQDRALQEFLEEQHMHNSPLGAFIAILALTAIAIGTIKVIPITASVIGPSENALPLGALIIFLGIVLTLFWFDMKKRK